MAGSNLWAHFCQNYFMADRLAEYRGLLSGVLARGYRFLPMADFAEAIRNGIPPEGAIALLRVDVDSDPRGARRMFGVERALGIRAAYYFRLCTIDRPLISEMVRHGTEVGYHFEEASTLARRRGFQTVEDVKRARDGLRQQFRTNVERFCALTGVSPRTAAAHGDFLNRKLGVSNNFFVDRRLLEEAGLVAEAYEPWLVKRISARIADRPAPQSWHPSTPDQVLDRRPAVVSLIVHPRQWVRSPSANARADVQRIRAEAEYRLSVLRRSG